MSSAGSKELGGGREPLHVRQGHSLWKLILILICDFGYIAMATWHLYDYLSEQDYRVRIGVIDQENATTPLPLDISPHPVVNIVWIILYVWNFVWVVYSLVLLCRNTQLGYLYCSPGGGVVPVATYLLLAVSLVILRLRHVDAVSSDMAIKTLLYLLTGVILIPALALSQWGLCKVKADLEAAKYDLDLWAVRLLVHNGLGIFASWMIATGILVELNTTLTYQAGLSQDVSSSICISILAFFMVIYAGVDLEKVWVYSIYTLSPYVVVLYVLCCIIQRNWRYGDRNAIMVAVMIALTIAMLLLKLLRISFGLMKYCFDKKYTRQTVY